MKIAFEAIHTFQISGNTKVIDALLKSIPQKNLPDYYKGKEWDIFDLLFDPLFLDQEVPNYDITYRQLLKETGQTLESITGEDITGHLDKPLWEVISTANSEELQSIYDKFKALGIDFSLLKALCTTSAITNNALLEADMEAWNARVGFRQQTMKKIFERLEKFINVLSIRPEKCAQFVIGRGSEVGGANWRLMSTAVAKVININLGSEIFSISSGKSKNYWIPAIVNTLRSPEADQHFTLGQLNAIDSFIQYIIDEFFAGSTTDYQAYVAFIQMTYFNEEKAPSFEITGDFESFGINHLNPSLDPKEIKYISISYPDGSIHRIKFRSKSERWLAQLLGKLKFEAFFGDEVTNKDYHSSEKILAIKYEYDGVWHTGYLDFGLVLNHEDIITGALFEYLGFGEKTSFIDKKSKKLIEVIYGPRKDALCKILVEAGFAPIYVVGKKNVLEYYQGNTIEHISKIAPLLSKKQITVLVDIMVLNPNVPLEDLIQRLMSGDTDILLGGFRPDAEILAQIQTAFGYTGGVKQGSFGPWWANFAKAPSVWINKLYAVYSEIIGNQP
jgi:hypothetical protein